LKRTLIILLIIILCSILYSFGYLYLNPQFGGSITDKLKEQYAASSQWDGDKFINLSETTMDFSWSTLPGLLKSFMFPDKDRRPQEKLPMQSFDKETWATDTVDFKFIWFGHSVGLMRMGGKNLLIDPMFGHDASPVGPKRTERFTDSTLKIIDELPFIDAVLITHDHYDHLDYDSFVKLKGKVGHYFVPLGVKRHLLVWEIDEDQITELDWWQSSNLGNVVMTFVPSRHFSGRGLTDNSQSLWGGWTFTTASQRVYWSGDGGYDTHFKEIGERIGPFDWAFLECGQYNENWAQIHMMPEETVQAAIDVKAKTSIPIHWGAFDLALHAWNDPVKRFSEHALERKVNIAMPILGEEITFQQNDSANFWWEKFK
jgi:L-ascorbate metabolism protein UlaG (beta-lactamase superfamily)